MLLLACWRQHLFCPATHFIAIHTRTVQRVARPRGQEIGVASATEEKGEQDSENQEN